jgi:hypothetical protein
MRTALISTRPSRFLRGVLFLLLVTLLWALAPIAALAETTSSLTIQLNKLETDGDTCRAYIVLENRSDLSFDALRLDLVMFDVDGVIARRLAVDAAPLAAGRTSVRVFAISSLACDNIGRVLLNDVLTCADASGERTDCMDRIAPESIAGVPFIK